MSDAVFWDTKPCGSSKKRRFGGTYRDMLLRNVGSHQKTTSFNKTVSFHLETNFVFPVPCKLRNLTWATAEFYCTIALLPIAMMRETVRGSCKLQSSFKIHYNIILSYIPRPPLWSAGQSSWLLTQRSRVRFPALPDFLSSSGSGTGSTQPL
jgi:hypothetical protein